MARSVILNGTPRCNRCQLPPRWCICRLQRRVECPLQTEVLMHRHENNRPSGTGQLIKRLVRGSREQLFWSERPPERGAVAEPGKTLWILHPHGEPLPPGADPSTLQILLLDGSWRQAGEMFHTVKSWGRPVSMPARGPSRYWLRSQTGPGNYCTVETLIFLLAALNLDSPENQLRLQFELHVYAGLRARGAKSKAAQYVETSPVRSALSELIEPLIPRRPNGTDF